MGRPKLDTLSRELLASLYFASGIPELAHITGATRVKTIDKGKPSEHKINVPKYSIDDYDKALESPDYDEFRKEIEKLFHDNAEGFIIGELYRAKVDLQMSGGHHENYQHISRHFREMHKMSNPILERLAEKKMKGDMFPGFEPVIAGVNDDPDDSE